MDKNIEISVAGTGEYEILSQKSRFYVRIERLDLFASIYFCLLWCATISVMLVSNSF